MRIAVRTLAILLLTLFLVWLILFVTKGRFLRQPFETVAGNVLEREVAVGGDFQLYFAPFDVKFLAEDMRIANPEWARADAFFTADRIDTRIKPLPLLFGRRVVRWIDLEGADLALEWDAKGDRNTWTFGDPDEPPERLELPDIRRGTISGTELIYRDPVLRLFADIGIETVKATDTRFDSDIRFAGDGTMRDKPFTLSGSLMSPNETVSGGVNKLALQAEAARTVMDVSGTLPAATRFEGADLKLGVRGFNIAQLFDFLGIAVPETRAYRFDSALTYDGSEWKFDRLKGVFGDSDLAGTMRIGMPGERLRITADLATDTLDIVDAGPFIGYDPERLDALGKAGTIRTVNGRPRVLPDATLRLDAIGRFDADVRYRIARVRAESFPLSNIDLTLGLDRSLLTMKPLKANIAGGTLTADIALNARDPQVRTDYGIAAADPILIDTKKNVMLGRGGFSFRTEAIDMAVRADAKTFSLFSAQSPVGVNGYFADPKIDPISGALLARAGAGLGLAAAAGPLGGILAFVDPGDAKAAACGPVLAGARASAQRTDKGKPRDDVGAGITAKTESGTEPAGEKKERRKKFLGIF